MSHEVKRASLVRIFSIESLSLNRLIVCIPLLRPNFSFKTEAGFELKYKYEMSGIRASVMRSQVEMNVQRRHVTLLARAAFVLVSNLSTSTLIASKFA